MALAALSVLSLVVSLLPMPAAQATPPAQATPVIPAAQAIPAAPMFDDTREPSRRTYAVPMDRRARQRAEPKPTPPVGTIRQWLGLDDTEGTFYRKDYTLRGSGAHIEVWVATDLAFPDDDCRTGAVQITDAQVRSLITEFDTVIRPKETAAFSTPPDRHGTAPVLAGDFTGDGEKTVTLVDNIRDDNFYDFPEASTYVAGFFSAQLSDLVDRNVMTVDAYDWEHRSGTAPPDEPTGDLCTSRPARPRMYEGTFAHEWQHLLQSYTDPGEVTWVDEGLSDYAQTLVGYVDASKGVYRRGADAHLTCFQGFGVVRTRYNTTPRDCGGPQNSLNLWDEGAPAEVLADYGHAYQFMLYLAGRFGPGVISRIHRDGTRHGLAGVAAALPGPLYDVLHDFQTMTLADKVIGDGDPRFGAASLRSTVNLDNPAAYEVPGAAPNGADYVPLAVSGKDLSSVRFSGARTLPPLPLEWTVRDGALFSGDRSGTDAAAVVVVTVHRRDPTLRLRTRYGAERDYDYGYVTVSTDGGRTYTAIAGDHTVPGPLGPAVTGDTGGFVPHRYDLSAYAGRKILLGFRYVSDGAVNAGGWYVDDIAVGARRIGPVLGVFRSPTQIVPTPVHHWEVKLIGLGDRTMKQVPVTRFAELRRFGKVVAVIAYDEPSEQVRQYARYTLTVNGVRQPGG
ncbi:MAG TPA: peptidase M6 immune inhibitor A [Actinoplanes sp.]|nr:peptidase M6 immune inhibitor A [Actinoplanes sp.]